MVKETYKKVLLLGLALLIVAGILVIMLKGFNVNMMYKQHEEIVLNIGKEYSIEDVDNICKEVFQNKKYQIRKIERFGESFAINVINITDDEKDQLVEKVNEKFESEFKVEDVEINTIANVRIRDWFTPYIRSIIIAMVITIIYMIARFRKNHPIANVAKLLLINILTILALGSVIAIARLPIIPSLISCILSIVLLEMCVYISKNINKE